MIQGRAQVLFEVSWEVCNKVGGIYTVVASKAALMKEAYPEYFLVGPFFKDKARGDFEELTPPDRMKRAFDRMAREGITCHFGKWLVKGEPQAVLIEYQTMIGQKNELKKHYWEDYQIDSYTAGWDFEEPMLWSTAVGKLVQAYLESGDQTKAVVHCHEWLAGFAILYLKKAKVKAGTVFTTHATMLGRSIAGTGMPLYSMLNDINPDDMSAKLRVRDKFTTERACARACDTFTTVSQITGMEAEKILGRKPDVLVLNGLDIKKFPTIEETSIQHVIKRDKIREYLAFHFFPYYTFDLDHNLVFFVVGRYEHHNKGYDILIKSLGKLNEQLKKEKSDRSVCVFFWIPAGNRGVNIDLLKSKNAYRHIQHTVDWNSASILRKIVQDLMTRDNTVHCEELFSREFLTHIRKDILQFKKQGTPIVCTHYLEDEGNDPIMKGFRENGLLNREEDPVKVIFYPVYLDGNDGLLDLAYYDAMVGCHLGLFPSYYEPWGYTPLEAAAMGVPSLTTDMSGFGQFMLEKQREGLTSTDLPGIKILERFNKDEDTVTTDFTDYLHHFVTIDHAERVRIKIHAKYLAQLADWERLAENYRIAHNIALEKVGM